MSRESSFYTTIDAMEPLLPEDNSGKLESLAIELVNKSAQLSASIHPVTREIIGNFLRPMNSYYSNLIEGHDTHPIDINNALNNNYSDDKIRRNLQLEAKAHVNVINYLPALLYAGEQKIAPSSSWFLTSLHREFYTHLPTDFTKVVSKEGIEKTVLPGKYRVDEVEVGRHIAPHSSSVERFMNRFEEVYNPFEKDNKSAIKRIISIAASHHRLAWIHPFLDGNGRVVRLYSDACFIQEKLDAMGLWSISRGLARSNNAYKTHLANADMQRLNDYDGRGNLSNKMLIEFCVYFLETALDQINFMLKIMDADQMIGRIHSFTDLMVARGKMSKEAKYILIDVFLKGKISKPDAMRITNLSDKTLKNNTDSLIQMGLLRARKEGIIMMYYPHYPLSFSPILFPGLYPSDKEVDILSFF
jgi:Fic family protein